MVRRIFIEIRTLKYFLAVARGENMTRAAEKLHVTQPTLSKQLKSLEFVVSSHLPKTIHPVFFPTPDTL